MEVAFPQGGWGVGLLRAPPPQRRPVVQRPPPPWPSKSAWRHRAHPVGPLSTFPLPQGGKGGSLGTKVSLCFGPSCLPPSAGTCSDSFPGQRARSLERAGVREGITASPPAPPPAPPSPGHSLRLNELPTGLPVRPLSQELALQTWGDLQPRPRAPAEALASR